MDNRKDYIKKAIRQNAVGTLFPILFFVLVAGFAWYDVMPNLKGIFNRQTLTTVAEADNAFKTNDRFVDLVAPELYDAYQDIETIHSTYGIETSRKLTSFFMYTELSDYALLLVELPYSYLDDEAPLWENVPLTGVLKAPSQSNGAYQGFVDLLVSSYEVTEAEVMASGLLSIAYLDATNTPLVTSAITLGLTLLMILLILAAFYQLIRAIHPHGHKFYKRLEDFGYADTMEDSLLDAMNNPEKVIVAAKAKNGFILKDYIVNLTTFTLHKTVDLRWIYLREQKNRGVRVYFLSLNYVDGTTDELRLKNKEEAETMLGHIALNLPVFPYYAKDLAQLFKTDLPGFIRVYEDYLAQRAASLAAEDTAPTA